MNTTYCLYDLVRIDVDTGVREGARNAVAFQIGYFGTTPRNDVPYHIDVLPYEDFCMPDKKPLDIYYGFRGIQHRLVVDDANRIAIERHDHGYTVWVETNNFLITHFIQMLFQNQGIAFVHSAAVADSNGNGLLLAGAGGIGKTGLIGRLIKSYQYRLLGDDIVALSEKGDCFAFPRPFIIKDYHESVYPELCGKYRKGRVQDAITALKVFIRVNAPFQDVIRKALIRHNMKERIMKSWHAPPYLAAVPISEIFGRDSICEQSLIKRIVFMQRYTGNEFRLTAVAADVLADKLFSIINFEWVTSYSIAVLLSMYNVEQIEKSMTRIRGIIESSVASSKNSILYIPETATFPEMADFFERHCLSA